MARRFRSGRYEGGARVKSVTLSLMRLFAVILSVAVEPEPKGRWTMTVNKALWHAAVGFFAANWLIAPMPASGQDATVTGTADQFQLPEPSEVLPLRRGAVAPHDGLLIGATDLLQIRNEYERMRFLLTRTAERDAETCDVRVLMEHAHLVAAEERLTLRDDLWTARQQELMQQIAAAQERANRAAERGWWESPALFAVLGAALVGVIWIATVVR